MYNGLKIVDFHTHFPTNLPWFKDMAPDIRQQYVEQRGEERAGVLREQAMAYSAQWRRTWGYAPPEQNPPDDDTQADRWAAEIEKYDLRAVGFVTGGGNDNLAKIVAKHPDKFIGFAHHYPFAEGAADELRRAVNDLGMKGYKLLAPMLDKPIEDKSAYPVWEACAELDIPVLIHFGIQG
ncbi:MAG: amidohydrolase family protein, partial [Aggregatilineales bacterium]